MTLSIFLLLLHPWDTLFAFLHCILQFFLHVLLFSHSLGIPVGGVCIGAGSDSASEEVPENAQKTKNAKIVAKYNTNMQKERPRDATKAKNGQGHLNGST